MEAKHTPGPWTAGWTGNVGEPGLGRPCVGTAGAADWVGPEGAESDARLIAAAPDLLAACESALARADFLGEITVAKTLRAAIAKATGGAR